jgi:TPR repeat protein
MKCFTRHALLAAALGVALSATPARADFYSLEGRFQCLDRPDAVCFDATPDVVPPPPRDSRESALSAPAPTPAPEAAAAPPKPPAPPPDPIIAAARRVAHDAPAAGDIALLRGRADAGDGRAIELLAWCALHGIGMTADPVAAYALYGRAAAAGVAHARRNQALIFEHSLTSAERQHLLDVAAESQHPGSDSLAALGGGTNGH